MPRTPQRAGWWRFPAPSFLVFVFLIGFLPWVEVGCEGKPSDFDQMNKQNSSTGKKSGRKFGEDGKFVVATQNAYQTILARSSPGRDIEEIQRQMKAEMEEFAKKAGGTFKEGKLTAEQEKKKKEEEDKNRPDPAWLVAVFFGLVLVAVALGFALAPGLVRTLAFGGSLALAILLLGIQTAVGFPIQTKLEEDLKKNNQKAGAGGMGAPIGSGESKLKPYCRPTPWYYVAWGFLVVPVGLLATEEIIALATGGRRKKPRRRRDYDEAEEDEDDRPRRRRPREEDEVDRPRAKRRLDEDEDDRPRRRPPPCDDDEDERPRRRPAPREDIQSERPRRPVRDEEEDRPRRRPARDEDEEDRPRPRRPARDEENGDDGLRRRPRRSYDD
jgi:hypothetical protein